MSVRQEIQSKGTGNSDFLCEYRLKELDPELSARYRNSVFAMDRLLANYKTVFPFFTNHTFEHSEQVTNFCNIIAGPENVARLNADEIYILLMGAGLHDVGMGISENDFYELKGFIPGVDAYMASAADQRIGNVTRAFHQEFSAQFIRKYRDLFEIPSSEHLYCICQVARGHRKMDLLNTEELDPDYRLPNGNPVRLPYLAALVKLADELDIAADRNLLVDYANRGASGDSQSDLCFKCHEAIRMLSVEDDRLILYFHTEDPTVYQEVMDVKEKVMKTFREFKEAVAQRTDFRLVQTKVEFVNI